MSRRGDPIRISWVWLRVYLVRGDQGRAGGGHLVERGFAVAGVHVDRPDGVGDYQRLEPVADRFESGGANAVIGREAGEQDAGDTPRPQPVGQIGAGHSVDDVLADYPYLEREDVMQALRYAAWRAEEREIQIASA